MSFTDFRPNEDVTWSPGASGGASPTDTAGNRYQNVDEVTLDETDYTFAKGGNFRHDVRFSVSVGDLAGRTITSVEMLVDAKIAAGSGASTIQIGIDGNIGDPQSVTGSTVRYSEVFATNPSTGSAWTVSEAAEFDTSRELILSAQPTGTADVRMYRYTMRVNFNEIGWGAIPLGF